jgi:hypothetical protein
MKRFVLAISGLALARPAFASKEGILALSSFRLESDGIGSSGKVVVEGKQNDKRQLTNLEVTAFGKHYVLPKSRLNGLADLMVNGVRISYEHGYAELGGRTIYIQLQFGFISETQRQALVTLTEDGKFNVRNIEPKKE